MSYFIAYKGLNEWRPRARIIYSTSQVAEKALAQIVRESAPELAGRYKIMDADHEPGRSILSRAGPAICLALGALISLVAATEAHACRYAYGCGQEGYAYQTPPPRYYGGHKQGWVRNPPRAYYWSDKSWKKGSPRRSRKWR